VDSHSRQNRLALSIVAGATGPRRRLRLLLFGKEEEVEEWLYLQVETREEEEELK